MQHTWLSLIPAIIMLTLAFATHRIILSLFCGIISAALILNNFAPLATIQTIAQKIFATTELSSLTSWASFKNNWAIFMCSFLIILGVIIVLIGHSGGAWAYATYIKRKVKNKKGAQSASLALSFLFFIDDYFSCLTVGSVMRTVTDSYNIARVKLAFLVNSMAAPLCIITPISSWVAYIIMQCKKVGISDNGDPNTILFADPFITYLKAIPFIFYSFIIIITSWFVVRRNISIGLMKKHENKAHKIKNLQEKKQDTHKDAHLRDFVLPLGVLISTIITGILYSGNFFLFGGNNGFLQAFKVAKTANALFVGALITLCTTVILLFLDKKLNLKDLGNSVHKGFGMMGRCIVVLILAWTLSDILKYDLGTGQYIANLLLGYFSVKLLPLLFFIICAVTSISTGSAWGCMAIMIPIAIPMTISMLQIATPATIAQAPIIIPTLGAILAGAVTGNHISPLADATIVTAASTQSNHIDHVRTQHSYAIPALVCSGISFLLAGLLSNYNLALNAIISLSVGLGCNLLYVTIRNR